MVIVIISASFGFGLGFAALGRLFVGVLQKSAAKRSCRNYNVLNGVLKRAFKTL
jgi:hypothetical protein